MMLMGHDPDYAAAQLEALGYRKEKDIVRLSARHGDAPVGSARRMLDRPLPAFVTMRRLNFKDYANEIRRMVDIFNDAWSGNWGFVPLTERGGRGWRNGCGCCSMIGSSGLPK